MANQTNVLPVSGDEPSDNRYLKIENFPRGLENHVNDEGQNWSGSNHD